MYIASALTASSGLTDVPVNVLQYGERRVFVQTPRTYEDAQEFVRTKFGLDHTHTVVLETETLNVCRGKRVEIDSSAWQALCSHLDVILVTTVDAGVNTPKIADESTHARQMGLSSSKGHNRDSNVNVDELKPDLSWEVEDEETGEARDELQKEVQEPNADHRTRYQDEPEPDGVEEGEAGEARDELQKEPQEPANAAHRTRYQNTLDYDDFYLPDTPAPEDPPSDEHVVRPSTPPVSDSEDDSAGYLPAARKAPTSSRRVVQSGESASESDGTPETELLRPAAKEEPRPAKASAPVGKAKAPADEKKQGVLSRPTVSQTKKEDKPVAVKKEKLPAASTSYTRLAPPDVDASTNSVEVDPRFLVDIKHIASDRQAMFKTRAGHKVEKVLAGVCKSFGLDYKRATLVLLVEIEEDGDVLKHRFPCEKTETMGRCGVEAGSKLVVEMDDE